MAGTLGAPPSIGAPGVSAVPRLGVQEFECLFVDFHILPEGDGRGLGASNKMAPAPGLTGGVKLFHNRLMVLKGVHLREVVVANDLGQPRHEGGRVVATVDILLGEIDRNFDLRHGAQFETLLRGPVDRRILPFPEEGP